MLCNRSATAAASSTPAIPPPVITTDAEVSPVVTEQPRTELLRGDRWNSTWQPARGG